jgi:hypothetical protein
MTHRVEVSRRRGHDRKRYDQENVAPGTPKGWTIGKRRQVDPEGSTGVKDSSTRRQLRLKNEKTAGRIFEIFRL